tara:strand:- start:1634 stop:2035 length:402 start_codon:yes stop_codon:yes gene_type:complete
MQKSEFYGPVLRGYDRGKLIGNKAPFVSTYPVAEPEYYRAEDADKPTAVAIKRNEYKWSREEKGWVPIDDSHASVKISDHDNGDGTRDVVARRPDGQTWTERLGVSEYSRVISEPEAKYEFIRHIKNRVLELE